MLTLKRLEIILDNARAKGASDDTAVKFCAGADGVTPNMKIDLNAAANFTAGSYLENPEEEVVLEAPVLVLNQ